MEYIQPVIDWYLANINYFTIFILMTIESSFIPFPSEVVVPVAAWKASQGELNMYLVVLFSTLGALVGALINYFLSITLGRVLIYKFADTRFAHFCLINREKVEQAESYFVKYGNISTFIGRLIPGIRQLISIPAGLAKMKFGAFCIFTALGALIWNIILAALGYIAHGQMDVIKQYNSELGYALLGLGVLFVAYLVYNGVKRANGKTGENH
ncbi:MAG: DedA family protein [Bacteroidales bacterium]|jgi:membrane protein DedA with SNARE-associated domain|nr:DedA family protein [Bacteroidales bacterium]